MDSWQLQEAKNKFSHLIRKARQDGPQIVTRHGEKAVVILSFDDYKKLVTPKTDLVTFLQTSPLAQVPIETSREKDLPRDITL